MKKLLSIVALSILALSSILIAAPAQAGTASNNFDVTINLSSLCQILTPAALPFVYTSFQGAAASGTTTFNLKCTNTLPYALSLDSTAVTDLATNLAYTLALSGATAAGTASDQLITVTGTMAAGQRGTCATDSCSNASSTNKQRTLTVIY